MKRILLPLACTAVLLNACASSGAKEGAKQGAFYGALGSAVASVVWGRGDPLGDAARGAVVGEKFERRVHWAASEVAAHLESGMHVALRTEDEIDAVSRLRKRGVEFLHLPDTYYEIVWDRVGEIAEDREKIKELGILVDRDDEGYLLQIFTMPLEDRPTLFFEVIERHGSRGFGIGNFKALFVSIEREQALRGNL